MPINQNLFFTQLSIPDQIIPKIRFIRKNLISGLVSVELPSGWPDSQMTETQVSTWSSAIILKTLVKQEIIPENYCSVITNILSKKIQVGENSGWSLEARFQSSISTYVTSDILSLLITLNDYKQAVNVIQSLNQMVNKDGGWGVCPHDTSKVKPTIWVLNSLIDAFEHPGVRNYCDKEIITEAVRWLYNAQNDDPEDSGWGFLPNLLPSSISSTSGALDVLIRVANNHEIFGVKKELIRRGISTLINMGENGFWKGSTEDFEIIIDGKSLGRHVTGGLGTIAVIKVLLRGIEKSIIPIDNDDLFMGIQNLLSRCKSIKKNNGFWLFPSEDGGPPIIWNSAYAVEVLSDIEKFFLDTICLNYVDTKIYKAINAKINIWRKLFFLLMIGVTGVALTLVFKKFIPLLDWFAKIPILVQGLILIVLTVLFEEFYYRIIKPSILKIKKTSPSKSSHFEDLK